MTIKDELGLLYRDMVKHKLWNDLLAEKETNKEKKQAYKGEAYFAMTTASKIRYIVMGHFKDGNKVVNDWEEEARVSFKEYTSDLK